MTGDAFQARDRHSKAVRRRLRDLQEMGVIDCRIGHDLDGEERRTEIELKPPPQVDPQELAAAAAALARWRDRYGSGLKPDRAPESTTPLVTAALSPPQSANAAALITPARPGRPAVRAALDQIHRPLRGLRSASEQQPLKEPDTVE